MLKIYITLILRFIVLLVKDDFGVVASRLIGQPWLSSSMMKYLKTRLHTSKATTLVKSIFKIHLSTWPFLKYSSGDQLQKGTLNP